MCPTKSNDVGEETNEPESEKRLNDDILTNIKNSSGMNIAKYTTLLEKYADIQKKRQRADLARRHFEVRKKRINHTKDDGQTDKRDTTDKGDDERISKKRYQDDHVNKKGEQSTHRSRSWFRSESREPSDGCGKKRRRSSCGRKRRKRKKSCGCKRRRKSRRRKSCGKKRRRRRSKSCGRRKRKSCKRKAKRRRC